MKGREGMVEEVTERKRKKKGRKEAREKEVCRKKRQTMWTEKKWEGLKRGKRGR